MIRLASKQSRPHLQAWTTSIMMLTAIFTMMATLAGCTSTPLPPWTPGGTPPSSVTRPAPSATLPATPSMDAPADARTSPVPARGASASPADEPLPYGPAVAARFPAPTMTYSTPGLLAGRTTFTTQSEMHAWLLEQVAAAARNTGVKSALLSIGSSQNRQPLEALVLTRAGSTDPGSLQASGKPTVLLIGQQHGDEPAGSEALLVIARELSQGLLQPLLERINVIIVPRSNPDGAAAGQRVTQGGLDMNRDHLLLATPEAQALAKLTRDYRPTVVVDAHEYTAVGRFLQKFGALQRFDALLQYATTANTPEFLTRAAEEWYRRPLLASLQAQKLSAEWYYTTSSDLSDKKISMGGVQPDTGRKIKTRIRPCGYWLSSAATTAVERLRMHGVQVMRVVEAGSVLGDSYREVSRASGERLDVRGTIAAAAPVINAQVSLVRGVYDVPRNSYYISLNQSLGNLVLAALEPDSQNSYFANSVLPDLQSTVRVMTEPTVKLEPLP